MTDWVHWDERSNVRVEEVGKRFDDWVITLKSAIVNEKERRSVIRRPKGSERGE